MKLKSATLLVLVALAALAIAGCAQDSTNTTDENPAMQKDVMTGGATGATSGGSSSTNTTRTPATGGTKGTKVALSTDPSGALKYNTDKLNANAGTVTVALTNDSSTPHDVAIATSGGKTLGVSKQISKSSTTLVVKDLKPGSYTFFCTLPGHKQAGMVGTLTVK